MLSSLCNLYDGLVVLAGLEVGVWSGCRSIHTLHMLQLDSYSNARLCRWLWAVPGRRLINYRLGCVLVGTLGMDIVLWVLGVPYGPCLGLGAWCVAGGFLLLRRPPPPAKKALVYTARASRILGLAGFLEVVVMGAVGFYAVTAVTATSPPAVAYTTTALLLATGLVVTQLAPLAVLLANLLLAPLQAAINRRYLAAARRRLHHCAPLVIGITGSYGKTSMKYIVQGLLREHYCTLKTPQSFNTLMGICRVVNTELQPQHQVFVVEMGAYRRGDIRELATLVRPQIGILTAIGPQHLERFKTLDNIAATKYELIASLPPSGIAVFNNDDLRCRQLAEQTRGVRVLRYGLDSSQPGLQVWAEAVHQCSQGQSFILGDDAGHRVATHTMLLGRHNVRNIVGAACVARAMGLSLQDIARAIPKIPPAPHRLQLLRGAAGVMVIDDAYNANPLGAAEALETLRQFEAGRRLLVTPGMIELGELEATCNEAFGAQAAAICDYVFLVGPRQTQAILRGLKRQHFPDERVRVVKDLAEATTELQRLVRAGDVVLFANDLPDQYTEV